MCCTKMANTWSTRMCMVKLHFKLEYMWYPIRSYWIMINNDWLVGCNEHKSSQYYLFSTVRNDGFALMTIFAILPPFPSISLSLSLHHYLSHSLSHSLSTLVTPSLTPSVSQSLTHFNHASAFCRSNKNVNKCWWIPNISNTLTRSWPKVKVA